MIRRIVLPQLGTDTAWRESARTCLAMKIRPTEVTWSDTEQGGGLFDADLPLPTTTLHQPSVSKSFVTMAQSAVWHTDADRFDRLYSFLWRVQRNPRLMQDRGDVELAHLRKLDKAVHRCQHKMKAFVRFREIGDPAATRRSFAAWFEPTHNTVEPTARFFANRFGDMDWRIVTPVVSAIFEGGKLRFTLNLPRTDLAEDAHEDLWTTYFCNIFNPARLKVAAMTSEMPQKYWKNLPEAASIPRLIAQAPARARAMAEAAPTLPPARAKRVQAAADWGTHWDGPDDEFGAALAACTRCPLHSGATQVVAGSGPDTAAIMIVGEQPGDYEDLCGEPFVGPSGQVLNDALALAGLNRADLYLTNAVKHFRHTLRGKRRIHQAPKRSHVEHCRFWLDAEVNRVKPSILVALSATAAVALTGRTGELMKRRGRIEIGRHNVPVMITLHPAYVLRTQDQGKRLALEQYLSNDLTLARTHSSVTETDNCRGTNS